MSLADMPVPSSSRILPDLDPASGFRLGRPTAAAAPRTEAPSDRGTAGRTAARAVRTAPIQHREGERAHVSNSPATGPTFACCTGMPLVLVILILLLLFGGGGFYWGGPTWGGGGLGLVLLICLIIFLAGGFRRKP